MGTASTITTRLGRLQLRIPKLEQAVVAVIQCRATKWIDGVGGVSTRRADDLVQAMSLRLGLPSMLSTVGAATVAVGILVAMIDLTYHFRVSPGADPSIGVDGWNWWQGGIRPTTVAFAASVFANHCWQGFHALLVAVVALSAISPLRSR